MLTIPVNTWHTCIQHLYACTWLPCSRQSYATSILSIMSTYMVTYSANDPYFRSLIFDLILPYRRRTLIRRVKVYYFQFWGLDPFACWPSAQQFTPPFYKELYPDILKRIFSSHFQEKFFNTFSREILYIYFQPCFPRHAPLFAFPTYFDQNRTYHLLLQLSIIINVNTNLIYVYENEVVK